MEFEPFASSSAGCCYRLSGGGAQRPIMLDCGLRFAQIQERTGYTTSGLDGCLISHAHGDHCKAASDLARHGVPIFASCEAIHEMGLSDHHNAYGLAPDAEFSVGHWQVRAFRAVHDSPGTLGFLVGSPDGSRLLYLTDSAYSLHTFDGLTHIAIEANYDPEIIRQNTRTGSVHHGRFRHTKLGHMSIEQTIATLKANDLSKVDAIYLLHLSDENSDAVAFRDRVRAATGIPTYVAAKHGGWMDL